MKALRFCMVTTFYPPYNFGGDGIAVQHLARALVRRGHDVTVIHDRDAWHALAPSGATLPAAEDDGVRVIGLRSRLRLLAPLVTQQTGRPIVHRAALRAELERDHDVVHFHNVSLVGGPGVLSYASPHAVRLYTAHEHWLVCPMHTLWRHRREPCDARECFRCGLHYRRPPQLWRGSSFHHRQLGEIDAFIALSEFSRAKHREMGFSRDMEVLPLFLPRLLPDPVSSGESPHVRPYFLYAGRLERLKGIDDVIHTFKAYPDADLLIAGAGTDATRLRSLARDISSSVHFVGRLAGAQLDRYMRHAVALVAPSRGFETFGLVLIEALRAGTPVIARNVGSLPEIVATSRAGELFETGDELLAAVRRLQHDRAHRDRLSANGLAAFEANWTEDALVPRYLELIRRLTPDRQRPARNAASAVALS